MRLFTAMLLTVLLVAGLTVGGFVLFDAQTADNGGTVAVGGGDAGETDGSASSLPRGAARVTGTVTLLHAEPGTLDPLPLPLEIVTPERGGGGGADFEGVTVDGEAAAIGWDAGRPLELEGEGGALVLDPVIVDVDANGILVSLDGTQGVAPGDYQIVTPVAVGSTGLAEPVDSVAFVAADGATVTFRGGATTTLEPRTLALRGPGAVVFEGALTVERADGTVEAARVDFASAPFEITLTPAEGGYTIEAILQGPVVTS